MHIGEIEVDMIVVIEPGERVIQVNPQQFDESLKLGRLLNNSTIISTKNHYQPVIVIKKYPDEGRVLCQVMGTYPPEWWLAYSYACLHSCILD